MKRKLLAGILLVICLFAGQSAHAQIIDDSTKVIYSPKTTLQLYERDVLEGRVQRTRVDTTVNNMHNERFWYNDTAYYQHLGNIGTAAQPLFYQVKRKIGVRFGRNAFDRYTYDPHRINYYDTRSPYSHLYYVQGQRGEQVFEGIYTRNITESLNAGVAYQILSANKQLGAQRRDGLIDNQAVKAFAHYTSENKKYDLFFNYTFMKVEQIETGGILRDETDTTYASLFDYERQSINLQQAATEEARNALHLTHIYKLAGENLKVYNTTDWYSQANEYSDNALPYDNGNPPQITFYPRAVYNKNRTLDENTYSELENQFGFTGNSKISYYNAYLKYRRAKVEYSILDLIEVDSTEFRRGDDATYNQVFVGGELRLFYENKAQLQFDGEFQISTDYRVRALGKLGGFTASQERILRSPSLTETYMISNHYTWFNENFNNSVIDRTEVNYAGKLGSRQHVKFGVHYNNIKRYVFFNEQAVPEQLNSNQRFWGGRLTHHINFGPIHFENFVAYTNTDEADKIRIPDFVVDSKLYFEGFLFKKALFGQFGVQAYMPTAYFADAYMPVTQQFYNQNSFEIRTYPVIDVFLNADIKTLNVFLKMSHVNDELWEPGYFVTPNYTGMRRSFTFGLRWMFFD